MARIALLSSVVAAAAVMLTGIPAHAQTATYARSYAVTPKDGMVNARRAPSA